jgi:ribosomal protein L44E
MQHYPKNTLRTLVFCNVCNKKTMHRVDKGRVGSCENIHASGLSKKQEKRAKEDKTGNLF